LTNHYERPFKPNFGGSIRELLFELTTDRRVRKVKERLKNMLETFEPRITKVVIGLRGLNNNEVSVQVNYSIKNGVSNQNIDMTLTRAR
jgi:phage baseplate assembly protein W